MLIQYANVRNMLTSSKTRLLSKKRKRKSLKIQFHTRRKIQHTYNTFIQHAYNTIFIQHVKYNLRWSFWEQVYRHCAVPRIKVLKGTTKIGKTSSLIRHMYILIYFVLRTSRYILMHAFRGII